MDELEGVIKQYFNIPHSFKASAIYQQMLEKSTSFDEYVLDRREAVSFIAKQHTLIYLDMKYWVYFRDAYLGNPISDDVGRLYALLVDLVNSNKVICPFSQVTWIELFKQNDLIRRQAAASVLDLLSKSISIIDNYAIMKEEISKYLRHHSGLDARYAHRSCNILDFSIFAMGAFCPVLPASDFPEEMQYQFQKGFHEAMSNIPFHIIVFMLNQESNTANEYKSQVETQRYFDEQKRKL